MVYANFYIYIVKGVDIWASGIIMLSILSNCCNFFSSPDDMTALAEIMTIFGTEELKRIASQLGRKYYDLVFYSYTRFFTGRYLICSESCPPLDLRKVSCTLRARDKLINIINNNNACTKCGQPQLCCLCFGTPLSEEIVDEFNLDAYDLLSKLLNINVRTRISASNALNHPFFKNVV